MHSPMHGGAPGGGMVHPGPMGNSMDQMQHPMLAPVGGGGGAGGGTPQQTQQQQQIVPVQNGPPVAPPPAGPPQVSLALLIEFIVQRTYHDLTVLAELLPRKTDTERKVEIFNFASRTRMLFVRLLALVKWAGSASKVDKCVSIVNFCERSAQTFMETADALARMARETLVRATLPNFHLPAAVEIITTGANEFFSVIALVPETHRQLSYQITIIFYCFYASAEATYSLTVVMYDAIYSLSTIQSAKLLPPVRLNASHWGK